MFFTIEGILWIQQKQVFELIEILKSSPYENGMIKLF